MSVFQSSTTSAWQESLSAGILPKWLLFISIVSIANSIQAYYSLDGTQQVYAGQLNPKSPNKPASQTSPVTPLSARTFGTWTFITSLVRLQAALAIYNPVAYRLAFATFAVAGGHFGLEWGVYGTARMGRGLAGPVVVSTSSLVWMWLVWGEYVKI